MPISKFNSAKISGIATCIPKNFRKIEDDIDLIYDGDIKKVERIKKSLGFEKRHIVEGNIHHYISNGMFIAASLACGYKMKYKDSYGPNAFFAMSQKDWNRLQETKGKSGPRLDKH